MSENAHQANDVQDVKFFKNKVKNTETSTSIKKSTPIKKKKGAQTIDIFELHEQILNMLDAEYATLPQLKQQAARYEWIFNNTPDVIEKHIAETESAKLKNQIQLIESGFREAKYLHATENILEEYGKLMLKPIKIDFMGNKVHDNTTRKDTLLAEFYNIAKDYISIQPIEGLKRSMLCEDCIIELQKRMIFYLFVPFVGILLNNLQI